MDRRIDWVGIGAGLVDFKFTTPEVTKVWGGSSSQSSHHHSPICDLWVMRPE
jgi:hypothetical protein